MTPKKSKFFGKYGNLHDENPDKRVYCPEWTFYQSFHDKLYAGAKLHGVTRSHYFERVVMNFFVLENPVFIVSKKNSYSHMQKVKRLRKLSIHPCVIELINQYSKQSNTKPSKYLTLLFDVYHSRYLQEIDLKKILF